MSVLTKAQITKAEENAVLSGTFSFRELMYTAGTQAAAEIIKNYPVKNKRIAVVCGKGNNGGDGCVIAEHLKNHEANVTVVTPLGEPVTENAKYYYNKLTVKKTPTLNEDFDIIIDALFGIGFKGELDENVKGLITQINNQTAVKISVDIPSGVECDSGFVGSAAVNSDLTLTFIALKPCFVLPFGSDFCGKVTVIDIGVPIINKEYEIIKKPKLNERRHNSHKGTYGTALIICGSYGMAGALMLSTKAALRSGLGIAKCLMPKSIYDIFTRFLPEAVCIPFKETKQGTLKFSKKTLKEGIKNSNSVLFGCGIGKAKDNEKILKYLINQCNVPIVIDADGINTLSHCIELLKKSKAPIILTPHPGEMARLCKVSTAEIEVNRTKFAKQLATKYGCTVVLKGSNTLIAENNGKISFNIIGNSGLATGGSGDVLAGVIVSLSAQGYSPENSAKYGVYLHSLAGDKAVEKRSNHALIPTDIIEEL